ncbi:motility associated factor glycosyltransferase family protein [Pelosinus propionicus]|uniref:Uncharacterized conserved protein n=1 Tax=Pelosinus propionicus DSM 13327 TaxID=1123291 RepID=A0A1I4HTE6_9FIRM|nr:6-hydroxymethylpterin diphosphokinase MptE-like protein [Pelosinus propionicus]SFL45043.1 Uncharacterized conserved protein [Pelosinus propionicus DSM 13327]
MQKGLDKLMSEADNRWEKENWALFKERYKVDKFTTANQDKIQVIESRVGIPTAKAMAPNGKWIFLHSSIDPVKEAEKISATVSTEPGKIIVVYGFALGYLVEALLKIVDERSLLFIIEPDPNLFVAAMKSRDLCHLISSERMYIQVSDSANKIKASFFTIYDPAKYNEIITLGLPGHQNVYTDSYIQSVAYVKDIVNLKLLSLVTMIKMGSNFIVNSLLNLVDYSTNPGVASLFGRWAGLPVIIVSAGPSLNKNIHLLKDAKGKAAIFAVGTAVKALKQWDIEPDFIFSIDPHPLNYEHLRGVDVGNSALIADIQSHHMIFENYKGPIFVSGDVPVLSWFGDSIEKKGKIESGGSVANTAFSAAYKMGANPIILVGQDLAYGRDGHSHAAGTNYADNIYSGGESRDYFLVKANDGGELFTDRAFYQFLTFFESWIEKYPEREYINATEGGAFIQGTKIMTLQEALNRHCQKKVDVQTMICESQNQFQVPALEPIIDILEMRLKDTSKTISEAKNAIKRLKQLQKACENNQLEKMQQHLKAVAKIYEKFENDESIREVAEWFSQHDLHGVFTRTYEAGYSDMDDYSAAIADYSIYYQKIIDGSKEIEELLQRCIEKFRRKHLNDK